MRVASIISILMCIYSGNLLADLSINYHSIQNNQKTPFNAVLIKQDLVRFNQSPKSESAVMIDLQSGDIVQLHPQSRRYFKINAQTIGKYATLYQNNKTMIQGLIDHGIAQLNPQKRDQVQQLMQKYKKSAPNMDSISILPTQKSDTVLGVDCKVVAVTQHGQLQKEVCIGNYQQLGLNQGDQKSMEQLKQFIQQFKESAPKQHQELIATLADGLSQIDGIPLKVVNYRANGAIRNIIQAGSISFQSIPDQAYRIPQDYQQQSFPVL